LNFSLLAATSRLDKVALQVRLILLPLLSNRHRGRVTVPTSARSTPKKFHKTQDAAGTITEPALTVGNLRE